MPIVGVSVAGPSQGKFLTLSNYLTEVRQLLRDEQASLYTDVDLTAFINRAIRQRDLDLGLNRVLYRFTLTASTFQYSFGTVTSGGTLLTGSSTALVNDVRSIIILPLGGSTSSIRYPLGRWPYSKLAYLLSTSYPTYPAKYALYGATTVFLGPPPAGAYVSEWDFIAYSVDLVNSTDSDTQPYPYSEPVAYQAAATAKTSVQRFDEADKFREIYAEKLNRVRARSRAMSIPQPFSDLPMR
jgi:hypothetical protein